MSYTTVFGAQPIYSAQPSYLALALAGDANLDWPLETIEGDNILATIIDVTPSGPFEGVFLPDATQGTPGSAITFSNLGADTFTIRDISGNSILTVASGESWTVYLQSNTTAPGVWRSFQQGAGTSTANAGSLAGAGLKAISTTLNTKMAVSAKGANYVILNADRATVIEWTGGVGQFTLPDPSVVGSDWYVPIKNAGTGSLTVVPTAGTIDSSGSLVLGAGESAFFYTDGANFFTMGLGQDTNSVFDLISINVAGTGNYILSGAELNRVSYKFTGVLTGNRSIIVPASVQQYWIDNETTGAFTLTIKCTGGLDPGKTIAQGNRNIFYCDGANVLDAVSSAFTPPLAVASGGTGAITLTGHIKGNGTLAFTASPTIPYADLSGTPTIPAAANPSGTIGLAAVNGVATTFSRSDGTHALSQAIAPTWTGQHTWSLPLRLPVGLVGTPALTWSTDLDTGWYHTASADEIAAACGGVQKSSITPTGVYSMAARHFFQDGTAALPGIGWFNDSDSGIARLGPDSMAICTGGAARFTVDNTGASAAAFTTTSARAVKRETGTPQKAAGILSRLRPLLYRLLEGNDREQLGLIAEEVHEVCPQLSDGKTVAYDRLAILLLAAWQDEHTAD